MSFKGTGLDVDVVPILYDGDKDWFGNLVSQDDGSLLLTNIPRHLEFCTRRKKAQEIDFSQVVRLVKFWTRKMKAENEHFRFKSFMVELVLAHLADGGASFADYPEALQHFFTYIAKSNFRERIVFGDYYLTSSVGTFTEPVKIIDPVNAKNNVSRLYTAQQADAIVERRVGCRRRYRRRTRCTDQAGVGLLLAKSFRLFISGVINMSTSYSVSESTSFTVTHARHMAAKVATDLKRMQRLYGSPSDTDIADYETEVIELLKAGYLDTICVRLSSRRKMD